MRLILSFFFLTLIASCIWAEYKDLKPARMDIARVEVQAPNAPKDTIHAIVDLWVYLNDIYLGTYPIPSFIPVLNGSAIQQIRIFPGIREFGIRSKPEIYNLLDPVTMNGDLSPGSEISIQPIFNYKAGLKVLFFENFETGNLLSVDLDEDKINHLTRSSVSVIEGSFSGILQNSEQHPLTEIGTTVFRIPASAYLELSFQASHDFNVGLNIISGSTQNKNYFLALKASLDWKRVYIPFREFIPASSTLNYQLIIRSEYQPSGQPTQFVYLDYLKIISLP